MDFTSTRTARDAGRAYLGAAGASLSCVALSRLRPTKPGFPVGTSIETYLTEPGRLRLAEVRGGVLLLDIRRAFTISPRASNGTGTFFSVTTQMYEYRLLDHRERELLVYHRQPGPRYAGPDHPHLHVSASLWAATSAVDEREIDLDKLHLATGQVSLAAFVRSLITEFGVEPRRPDWARVLDEAAIGELTAAGEAG